MTDPTAQARAAALLIAILDEPGSTVLKVNPQKWDKQIALLTAALLAVEQRVWEAAATEFELRRQNCLTVGSQHDLTTTERYGWQANATLLKYLVEWCRAQAQLVHGRDSA